MILYILSFFILFLAELCGTLRDLQVLKGKKLNVAFLNATASALWCIKIAVIVSAPVTIITGFIGAFMGVFASYWINDRFK